MRIEVHYDNGDIETLSGDSALVFVIRTGADGELRATLGLGGRLNAIAICSMLTLLEMQLQSDTDLLDIAVELWQEHRARLAAEAMMCDEREAAAQDASSDGGDARL